MRKDVGSFAGPDDNAEVDGGFAVVEDELQPILKPLREGGINMVAIRSYVTYENPRIRFLHSWGKGATTASSRTLKAAGEVGAAALAAMRSVRR